MKPILILAAVCAALCCVSPAEAKPGDRIRKLFQRDPPSQFIAVERPELQQKEPVPKPARFGPRKWFANRASARKTAVEHNKQKRAESKKLRAEYRAATQ